ncbi:anti-sigma-I factor RsgI6-like [Littorina saxatilis]
MNNIHINVTKAPGMKDSDITILIKQTNKSFPFGTAVYAKLYNNASQAKYRDFIGKHFNWAVPERYLKWFFIEPVRGQKDYSDALNMIHGLRSQGLKVRGHNLIWPAKVFIQKWVQALSGDDLREAVKDHIEETMNKTRGLVEHWDVINENLDEHWYKNRLMDPDFDLETYRLAHSIDPNVKLFINDYAVVATGSDTEKYLAEALRFKEANVGLYGMGVQCHWPNNLEPDPYLIKERLDLLSQAGVTIWVTELDVWAVDENTRADYYDRALRSLYGHPAVEGILFWGFWDERHLRGEEATLASGDDLTLNAAGRLVFDLFENQWMTRETHTLSESGSAFTVRGFHGDYELHVMHKMQERTDLKQTFTLLPGADIRLSVKMTGY